MRLLISAALPPMLLNQSNFKMATGSASRRVVSCRYRRSHRCSLRGSLLDTDRDTAPASHSVGRIHDSPRGRSCSSDAESFQLDLAWSSSW